MELDQFSGHHLWRLLMQGLKVQSALDKGGCHRPNGALLGAREACKTQRLIIRLMDRLCRNHRYDAEEPLPDGLARLGGDLLEHHNMHKACKARWTAAQGRTSGLPQRLRHEGALAFQGLEGMGQIVFGFDAHVDPGCEAAHKVTEFVEAVHPMSQPIFRFAPSPNGELHLGHALSVLLNEQMARAMGGKLLLRIEDIDTTRCRPELVAQMLEDLDWLGVRFDGETRRQSAHFDEYQRALDRLQAQGLVYPAFESRAELKAMGEGLDPDGAPLYRRAARMDAAVEAQKLASGQPYALRLDMAKAARHGVSWQELAEDGSQRTVFFDPALWGDVILARKDVPTSYHLSVVVDDAVQGVTHVVRGLDLYAATAVHRVLQYCLGLEAPVYHHHRLVLDHEGRKLSKSMASTSLRSLRKQGASPAEIRCMIGLIA